MLSRSHVIRPSRHLVPLSRYQSTQSNFYRNRQLELYASKEAKRLTLRQLIFFGRTIDKERLFKSANYVRTELPIRIAHRLRDLQALPYVVVTQEGVAKVYDLYWSAFEKFRQYPPITSFEENETFCHFLASLLNEHATVIPSLSLGLSLASPFLPPEQLDSFMRRMLVSRISRRVLAEHHITLSENFAGRSHAPGQPQVGIIHTDLDVLKSIQRCIKLLRDRPACLGDLPEGSEPDAWPQVIFNGHLDTRFPYILEHLEYIVFELLKNSMRATMEKHHNADSLPAIHATIAAGENDVGIRISDQGGGLPIQQNLIKTPSDLFSFSHVRNAARLEQSRLGALRSISSSQEGMWATVGEQVDRWQHTNGSSIPRNTADSLTKLEALPRIGIGLPMSYIFATYFGGSLELVSLDGWGTDVFLRLPKLGTNLEGIEV